MRMREIMQLAEAIPLSQAKPYVKAGNTAQYDELFSRFAKYARKDNRYRLYFPLTKASSSHEPLDYAVAQQLCTDRIPSIAGDLDYIRQHTKYPVPQGLLDVLKSVRFDSSAKTDCDLYANGMVRTARGEQRFGKILQSAMNFYSKMIVHWDDYPANSWSISDFKPVIQEIRASIAADIKQFQSDPVRQDVGSTGVYYMVVSRHPYDIAGMSTGRGWTSCTDLNDGTDRHYVLNYAKSHLIAYLIKAGDWNIEHPLSRLNIIRYDRMHPDGSIDRDNDYILQSNDLYGSPSEAFKRSVNRFCSIVNRGRADGLFANHHDDQYPFVARKTRNTTDWDTGKRVPREN